MIESVATLKLTFPTELPCGVWAAWTCFYRTVLQRMLSDLNQSGELVLAVLSSGSC